MYPREMLRRVEWLAADLRDRCCSLLLLRCGVWDERDLTFDQKRESVG